MAIIKSNNGQPIDMGKLMTAAGSAPAVGNMKVNARGDVLGPNGEIVKKNEDRVREYYKNNPRSSTAQASLKGKAPSQLSPDADKDVPKDMVPKTAATGKAEAAAKITKKKKEEVVAEPSEFDSPVEPLGYKEVELPNGDIEMVPYYKEEDK